MKYLKILTLTIALLIICSYPTKSFAVFDPLSVPNNKFGIHILSTHELEEAAKLVNTNGGEWGYVTIPIQSGDRDLLKWQKFFDNAKKNKIIPIIRLSTEGDYFNTNFWRKPKETDILDFANFLDSLNWPVKNRYIIVFNEVNRGDEWGGGASPSEYAKLLDYAVEIFKSRNSDYFIISAGLDNAAPNQGTDYVNQYTYMRQMSIVAPGIFNKIDGISSHSYPNPAFAQPPNLFSSTGTGSFTHEIDLIAYLGIDKILPVFITETGWSSEIVPAGIESQYYKTAFQTIWSNENIVAVTPFILQGSNSPFDKFSFLDSNGKPTSRYNTYKNFAKIKGQPVLSESKSVQKEKETDQKKVLSISDFSQYSINVTEKILPDGFKPVLKWLLKLN